jgi:hypothetical protein
MKTTGKPSKVFQTFVIGNKCALYHLSVHHVPKNVYLSHPVSAGVAAVGLCISFRIRNFYMWTDGCKHFLSKWFSDETMFSMPGRGNTN